MAALTERAARARWSCRGSRPQSFLGHSNINHSSSPELEMAKTLAQSQSNAPARPNDQDNGATTKPPEIVELLRKADQFLKEGDPGKALDALVKARLTSPWVSNAQGVCQLRLRNPKVALDVFRGLVLAAGGILLRTDVPAVFKTNYAVALLLSDNLSGCLSALAEVKDEEHPAVGRLKTAVRQWKDGLTFWQRMNWYMGGQPAHPVELSFPHGDLE
jgi:hypothetical protein